MKFHNNNGAQYFSFLSFLFLTLLIDFPILPVFGQEKKREKRKFVKDLLPSKNREDKRRVYGKHIYAITIIESYLHIPFSSLFLPSPLPLSGPKSFSCLVELCLTIPPKRLLSRLITEKTCLKHSKHLLKPK